ncbi:MAG: serine/threonine-protein phosphatase [Planctomycetes bacterium]|nr:serine/threonine-protein phosphatase [Planctomycetota bacterium]MCB9902690.1 serine/threonine-protein phosphatase [Planctomycetota bacterium]
MTDAPAPTPPPPPQQGPRAFFRAMLHALGDERTYDLGKNPSLWLGFLTALPTPVLALATDVPSWMKVLAALTPFSWAVLLGAAGRVGQRAQEEADDIASRASHMEEHLAVTEEALGEAVLERDHLEEQNREHLNELKLAEAVARSMLPDAIRDKRVTTAMRSVPSRFIGGDYLYASVVDERFMYFGVADVSGHGISAALVAARLHGLVRRLSLTAAPLESMLRQIHQGALAICRHTYFFVTCALFRLDLQTGVLEFATAGHPAQLLLRANGTLEPLRTRNRLLGMDDDVFDSEHPTRKVQLEPGDTVLCFTDGVFEILRGGHGEVLGEQGLGERLQALGPLEPSLILGELLQDLADFQGRSQFDDDVTLLVTRFNGTAG